MICGISEEGIGYRGNTCAYRSTSGSRHAGASGGKSGTVNWLRKERGSVSESVAVRQGTSSRRAPPHVLSAPPGAAVRRIITSGVHGASDGENDAARTRDGTHGASTHDDTHNTRSTPFPRRRAWDTPGPVVGRRPRVQARRRPGRDRPVPRCR